MKKKDNCSGSLRFAKKYAIVYGLLKFFEIIWFN